MDIRHELENFPHIDLESLSRKESSISDNVKSSMMLYNKAIDNLKTGSEDISIIELRKAIALNPEFNQAKELLDVCHRFINKNDENEVKVNTNPQEKIKTITTPRIRSTFEIIKSKPRKIKGSGGKIIKVFFGLTLGVAIIFVGGLVIDLNSNTINELLKTNSGTVATPKRTEKNTIAQVPNTQNVGNQKYDKLKEENLALQKEKQAQIAEKEQYKNVLELYEVNNLIQKGNYNLAADKLVILRQANFSGAEKEKFDNYCKEVLPKMAEDMYMKANELLREQKLSEALESFRKLESYEIEIEKMDNALYNMGICYKELKDNKNAIETFQKVEKKYPNSEYAGFAGFRIRELSNVN